MLLALELSSPVSSVALGAPDGVRERCFGGERGRALLLEIDALLAGCGRARTELSGVLAGTGPGSYTGLRIACAAARTLGYALRVPVGGVCSFRAAALLAPEGAEVHVLQDAYREEVYHACYRRTGGPPQEQVRELVAPRVLSRAAAAEAVPPGAFLLGDPRLCAHPVQALGDLAPRAHQLLQLCGGVVPPAPATPLYLRAALPKPKP